MGKELDLTRDLEEEQKLCGKYHKEPQYTIKTPNIIHQENQANSVTSISMTKCVANMGINNKTRTWKKPINKFIMETIT